MKTTISHLEKYQQQQLYKITSIIRDLCSDTQMIILFGSYARGNYKQYKDLKPDRKSGSISDYDILVITEKYEAAEDSYLWGLVNKKCQALKLQTPIRIITHDIDFVNDKLSKNQYFFSDIRREGCMLYDSGKFELIEQEELKPEKLKEFAKTYFKEWFESTEQFFETYEMLFEKQWYKKAAFNLHQTCESAYKTILLVFTNYCPLEHCLIELGKDAKQYSTKLENIFKDTEEERFKLLNYAYIGARYDINYKISKEDLGYLAQEVKKLLNVTKEICEEKIKNFN